MSEALKNDEAKVDLSLLPEVALNAMAKAMMLGEKKYGRYNYCKGMESSRLIAAALRHLNAWNGGENNDSESGASHLGHAMACCLMILRQQELGTLKDNRYTSVKEVTIKCTELNEEVTILAHKDALDNYFGKAKVVVPVEGIDICPPATTGYVSLASGAEPGKHAELLDNWTNLSLAHGGKL